MALSIAPFVVSLVYSQHLRKFSKRNNYPQWEKLFRYAFIFSFFLLAVEASLSGEHITKWIWHAYLVALLAFTWQQPEMRGLRNYILAFVPFVIVTIVIDLSKAINNDFFSRWNKYYGTAIFLTIVWMVAILYSQNKQSKAAEKERIKRQHEDELNRAIAIRKVELESLVAERTLELTQQKEELEHALNELRSTQNQLIQSEKMASLGELTAGIAHEIKNPLNFVNNFSEVSNELLHDMKTELGKGNKEETLAIMDELEQNLVKINLHGKRADSIVKGMLMHSRSSRGIKEPTDINALADEYLRLSYHGLRAKEKSFNASMKTDFDKTIQKIDIIPQEMGRAILNLLTNAFYAVNEKKKENIPGFEPTVSVSTKKSGNNVEIKVGDNGKGIPQNIIDKIFQPFFTTKPTGEGTGLGLSLSYDIITKVHGGELQVETKEGEYSEFIIRLPV